MNSFLIRIAINAVAIWVASLIISGITFGQHEGFLTQALTVVLVGAVFGVLNAIVKPILFLFSLPVMLLTLGLFTFVLNAFMLTLTSWVSGLLGLSFNVDDVFWSGILGAIVISLVSLILSLLIPGDE